MSSDRLVRNPLLPFGLSSPVPIRLHSSHLAGLTIHLYKARAEEFGTRALVLSLLNYTLALGTQIVAALRLRFRLRMRDIVLNARSNCTFNFSEKVFVEFKHTRSCCKFAERRHFASDKEDALPRVRGVLSVREQSRQGV